MSLSSVALLCIGFLTSTSSDAQNALRYSHWIFGYGTHLDVRDSQIKVLPNVPISGFFAQEGMSSIADEKGKLILFSDSENLYDSTFNLVENGSGLKSYNSCTQGVVILEHITKKNFYHVLTNNYDGLYHTLVEVSPKYPLGHIHQKNEPILQVSTGEQLAVFGSPKDGFYWIVTTYYDKQKFAVIKLNESGFSQPQVFDFLVSNTTGFIYFDVGQLKFSPDGRYLAISTPRPTVFCFNRLTGAICQKEVVYNKWTYSLSFDQTSKNLIIAGRFKANSYLSYNIEPGIDKIAESQRTYELIYQLKSVQLSSAKKIVAQAPLGTLEKKNSTDSFSLIAQFDTGYCCNNLPTFPDNYFSNEDYWSKPELCDCEPSNPVEMVEVPNIFTPNDDDVNEKWAIDPLATITDFECWVYNRWGQEMFYTTDHTEGWDGTFNDTQCAVGTYFYVLRYSTVTLRNRKLKGSILLVR